MIHLVPCFSHKYFMPSPFHTKHVINGSYYPNLKGHTHNTSIRSLTILFLAYCSVYVRVRIDVQ